MQVPSLHTLHSWSGPLNVECRSCQHRAVVPKSALPYLQGIMMRLEDLKLRCQTCGSQDIKRSIPISDTRRADWLHGATILMRHEV